MGHVHTKFKENHPCNFQHTSSQIAIFISFLFLLLLFTHFAISTINTNACCNIRLKFGTINGLIKADLSIKFGRNSMNIHVVMTNYLHKIKLNFCHTHRVNPLEEWAENCYVDGVTIFLQFERNQDKDYGDMTQNPACITIPWLSFVNKNYSFSHLPTTGKLLRWSYHHRKSME